MGWNCKHRNKRKSKLVDLTGVDTDNLGDGRFLRYDATSEELLSPVSATNLELIAEIFNLCFDDNQH